mmetsp:Transcript_39491/g.97897  ORF Transcript_39491/g.97897 Transcript_39491/m.97897 type:complete len:122 (-) Transcript_39491:600-965(-)
MTVQSWLLVVAHWVRAIQVVEEGNLTQGLQSCLLVLALQFKVQVNQAWQVFLFVTCGMHSSSQSGHMSELIKLCDAVKNAMSLKDILPNEKHIHAARHNVDHFISIDFRDMIHGPCTCAID